jgi:hypothetical protein
MNRMAVICDRLLGLLNEFSRKTSFHSKGYLPGSVLTFVTIIDPHTSTAEMCSIAQREASLVEGGNGTILHAELYGCGQ